MSLPISLFHEVTQTRVGRPSGNCTEATLASLLGVPLEEVPDLWCGDPENLSDPQPAERHYALDLWLRAKGLYRIEWGVSGYSLGMSLGEWKFLVHGLRTWDDRALSHDGYFYFSGLNPDGVDHMVVGRHGRVLWDPNPLRRGIVSLDYIGCIINLTPVSALKPGRHLIYDPDIGKPCQKCGNPARFYHNTQTACEVCLGITLENDTP